MKIFKDKIGSKYTPKRTILKKILGEAFPRTPYSKAHGFAMRSMSLLDMQISNSEKKFLTPLPNPGYAPVTSTTSNYRLMYLKIIQ